MWVICNKKCGKFGIKTFQGFPANWIYPSMNPIFKMFSASQIALNNCELDEFELLSLTSLTLILLFKTTPTFANSVDPDQMKPSDQDLHYLSFSL